MAGSKLDVAFHPRSVAVVGGSGGALSRGSRFFLHLVNYGYRGKLYPVTLNGTEFMGHQAYRSLKEIPGSVDYVICCLPAAKVPELLADCPAKGVQVLHMFTARFSETGYRDAVQLEASILEQARRLGIRIIGPNCMGVYNPAEGMAFAFDFPTESGRLAMTSQSGGAATEFINYAGLRGLRFSKVVSYGNALDFNESDYLDYLVNDPDTDVIASYIEGAKDGKRYLQTLTRAARSKPVIVLKAGRGSAGAGAVSSHTAALAGSTAVWETAIKQAGAVQAHSMSDMLNLAVSFCFLPPILGNRVGILGGGGGSCVLSADGWEDAGFVLPPLPAEIKKKVQDTLPEMWWNWVRNPIDTSVFPDEEKAGITNILRMMAEGDNYDLIVVYISVGGPNTGAELGVRTKREVDAVIDIKRETGKPVAVVLNTGTLGVREFTVDRWRCLAERKAELHVAGIPVYLHPDEAGSAIIQLIRYYQRRAAEES